MNTVDLRTHLVASGLAGRVATTPSQALANCEKLVAGDPEYTFGLDDWQEVTVDDARGAIVLFGGAPALDERRGADGWIDPDLAMEGIERHRMALEAFAPTSGRVLLATGHPTGLLPHYAAIGRALRSVGCHVVTALDDERISLGDQRTTRLRFVDAVACVRHGGDLVHTHRADPMEALLDALENRGELPDLVIGDHGMAGAAVMRGYKTLSIADVNDPALPLAQVRGRTEGVLMIDDNLPPALFEPVTAHMIRGI